METSIHVAAAGQQNLQKQLAIVANNIANASTVGFRSEILDFESLVSRSPGDTVHYPTMAEMYPSLEQGALVGTGNPLDVALSGEGWFSVMTPTGNAFTRDGRFNVDAAGSLKTVEGFNVLDAGGAPIQIDPNAGPPIIGEDGRILSNGRVVANIGVFAVAAEALTSRHSNSAFFASIPGVPQPVGENVTIKQAFLEQSNVSPVNEMVNLISITKAYESISSLIGKADDTLGRAVRELNT